MLDKTLKIFVTTFQYHNHATAYAATVSIFVNLKRYCSYKTISYPVKATIVLPKYKQISIKITTQTASTKNTQCYSKMYRENNH